MAAEPLPNDRFDVSHGTDADPGTDAEPALWAARPGGARRADRQGRVVQSMARKVTRPCRRNGCPAPAHASLVLDYAGKRVTLVPLLDEADPRFLEVCPTHAAGMDVPRGWDLVDEREDVDGPSGPPTAREMGSRATVAVLAEALRHPDREATPIIDEPDLPAGRATGPPSGAPVEASDLPHGDRPESRPGEPVVPATPSGRISQPGGGRPSLHDPRQLRLDPEDVRRPRPVPAALDD